MYMNAAYITRIDISSDMATPIDDQYTFTAVCSLPGKDAPKEASTNHKIIVLFHHSSKSPKVVNSDYWMAGAVSLPVREWLDLHPRQAHTVHQVDPNRTASVGALKTLRDAVEIKRCSDGMLGIQTLSDHAKPANGQL